MADLAVTAQANPASTARHTPSTWFVAALLVVVLVLSALIINRFAAASLDDPLLLDSTLGELATWMSDQTSQDEIESILGQYAENWAHALGQETLPPEVLYQSMKSLLIIWGILVGIAALGGLVAVLMHARWARPLLLAALLGLDGLLFIVPAGIGETAFLWVPLSIALMTVILLFAPGKITRVLGFFAVLSVLLVTWEAAKGFGNAVDYQILLPQPGWTYTTYPTLDEALGALSAGEAQAVVFDRRDLQDVMVSYPEDDPPEEDAYPNLRYLDALNTSQQFGFLPIEPSFPGRLGVAVRAEDTHQWANLSDLVGVPLATMAGEFADEGFLAEPRNLVLLDLKILTDINLPHLQTIAEALLQPARRNGSMLLVRILGDAALYTWGEALFGFVMGAVLGFLLGTVFAHSAMMERSLLPYVVASQTIPILAIAPMVVIWLGASQLSVSVIAAYLTFFPVTINTLRGLLSPSPQEVDLMRSYAASRWTIMWKLRFPSALPQIFTALKVSATSSVVGAIIGELPSGIGDGLGRAILDFSSDYSLISTPKLWGAIVIAASVGIFFFVIVNVMEFFVLRNTVQRT